MFFKDERTDFRGETLDTGSRNDFIYLIKARVRQMFKKHQQYTFADWTGNASVSAVDNVEASRWHRPLKLYPK